MSFEELSALFRGTNIVLKLSDDPLLGRYCVAARDLSAGEVVLSDVPVAVEVCDLVSHEVCHRCVNKFTDKGTGCGLCRLVRWCKACSSLSSTDDEMAHPARKRRTAEAHQNSDQCACLRKINRAEQLDSERTTLAKLLVSVIVDRHKDPKMFQLLLQMDKLEIFKEAAEVIYGSVPEQHRIPQKDVLALLCMFECNGFGLYHVPCRTTTPSSSNGLCSSGLPDPVTPVVLKDLPSTSSTEYDAESGNQMIGIGIYPRLSFFNHACLPNCCAVSREEPGGSSSANPPFVLEVRTLVAIPKGTELTINYLSRTEPCCLNDFETRRSYLTTVWQFDCRCAKCVMDMTNPIGSAQLTLQYIHKHRCGVPSCVGLCYPVDVHSQRCCMCYTVQQQRPPDMMPASHAVV